jgi:hypothetical protein
VTKEAGSQVAFRRLPGAAVLGLSRSLGHTDCIFHAGSFEVWRSRSEMVWDARERRRVLRPAVYRIVKLLGTGAVFVAGRVVSCEYVFVMRTVEAGHDWATVAHEMTEQARMLSARENE